MLLKFVIALTSLASSVLAQTNSTYIDPNSVSIVIRSSWCDGQRSICKTLCNKNDQTNLCSPTTLTWNCTCLDQSNPDVGKYIDSIPDRICVESWAQCNKINQNNATGQEACVRDIKSKCGSKNIVDFVASSSTSSASATATQTPSTSASASVASASASQSSAAGALPVRNEYSTGIFAAGLIAIFGFLV